MYTTDELFADDREWKAFHDVVFEATGDSFNPLQLRCLFGYLPEHIRDTAHANGLSDTVFRDEASVYMREQSKRRAFPQIPLCECGHDRSFHLTRGSQCDYGWGGQAKRNWATGEDLPPDKPCECFSFREVAG